MTILLAVGDCLAACLLAPVVTALRARHVPIRLAFAGAPAELAGMRELLGPPTEELELPGDAQRAEAADAFARRLLATSPATVVTCGHGAFAAALGAAAGSRGDRLVHVDGGVRAFGPATARSAFPPETDAREHCVVGDDERRELLREGTPRHAVHVVGDLIPEALAAVLPADAAPRDSLWFALEHAGSLAPGWEHGLVPAVARTGLPARTSSRRCAAFADVRAVDARGQLAEALAARVLVTDSVGWQRFAVAAGVPCVVLPGAGLWAPGVAAGLVTAAEPTAEGLLAAFQRAARTPRGVRQPATGASARIVGVLTANAPPATAIALPSDGDASGRTFGDDEAALVALALRRGTLNSTRGTMVTAFEKRFAQWLGRKHAIACASGSAAVHCAIAALRLQPGDEVITTPITDMGAITPILYEGAVPVFADVDPVTLNITPATVRSQLTDRTRAIVVTHLFGCPCDLDALQALARERDLVLIEDSAQAFGATWRGRKVGTFGKLGTFSLQQGKHITTGEGGIVATDDDDLARRVFLFVNKAWGYGDKKPDHYFPALNYRLTELQGAVALAQLPKLDAVVVARREVAAGLRRALADVPGLTLPDDPAHGTHSWWKFAFHVDPERVPGGPRALAQKLQAAGIACAPHYIQKPAFQCELFRDWRNSPVTFLPLQHNPRRERAAAMFDQTAYPGAIGGLDTVVVLPINERYTPTHVDHVAQAIRAAVGALQHA